MQRETDMDWKWPMFSPTPARHYDWEIDGI
jgi:hypothetical protein